MDKEILARVCPDTAFIYHVMTSIMMETCDDGTDPMLWNPGPLDTYIEVYSENDRIGLYKLVPWNNSTVQLCANILPQYRRTHTKEATIALFKFLVEHLKNTHKFIAFIPTFFPNVISYAKKSGWEEEGIIKEGFQKNGQLFDVVQVGATMQKIKEVSEWDL